MSTQLRRPVLSTTRPLCLCAVVLQAAACATAPVPVRVPDSGDYVYPTPDKGAFRANDLREFEQTWQGLLTGDASGAEKRFRRLRTSMPRAAAPETGLGYALLRQGKLPLAEAAFLSVVSRHQSYVPALAGAGTVFKQRGDAETAVELFRRAVEADSAHASAALRRRLGEAKLEVTEARVIAAHRALEQGQADRAIGEYGRLLRLVPELAAIRLELAELLVTGGRAPEAIEVLAADPGEDRQVLLRRATLELGAGRPSDALQTAAKVLLHDPRDDEARRLATRAQGEMELARMPEEYRRILVAPRITRGDLAALLSVKVAHLASLPAVEPPVATDISGSWARAHVLQMLSRGVMEVYPNHTFQPAGVVRRSDLAQTLARILDLVGAPARPRPILADVSTASLYYEAVARVVAAGLMDVTPAGGFEPWRAVTGPEAMAVIEALDRALRVGPKAQESGTR